MARQPEARQTRTQAAFASALGSQLHKLQPTWAALERSVRAAAPGAHLLLWLELQLQARLHSASLLGKSYEEAGMHMNGALQRPQLQQPWAAMERSMRAAAPGAHLLLWLELQLQARPLSV